MSFGEQTVYFDRIVLFVTSPAAIATCENIIDSAEKGRSPIDELINWLDIS